jgi:hypothetical protein
VIGLSDLPHSLSAIAGSWLSYGMRHSTDPDKFSEAAAILQQAFRERRLGGEAGAHANDAAAPSVMPVA